MTHLGQFKPKGTIPDTRSNYSGGSPGDRTTARFPPEPPSLACPTPQGRATAAPGGRHFPLVGQSEVST